MPNPVTCSRGVNGSVPGRGALCAGVSAGSSASVRANLSKLQEKTGEKTPVGKYLCGFGHGGFGRNVERCNGKRR